MRRVVYTIFILGLIGLVRAQSPLPPCPNDPAITWTSCFGAYKYIDGRKYVGEFLDDKRNGQGIEYNANGTVRRSGLWVDNDLTQSYALNVSRFPFNPGSALAAVANNGRTERDRLVAEVDKTRQERLLLEAQRDKIERDRLMAEAEAERVQRQNVEARLAKERDLLAAANVALQSSTQSMSNPKLKRVALVIGNARYTNVPALTNPPADVASFASALRDAGFQTVTVKTDLSQPETLNLLREFAEVADTADWAVVYYAGHGIEYGGVNYLVPIDARLQVDRDIDLEAIDLGKVMAAVEGAKRLRIIILDACRDNPFANQMRRTVASRSIGRGLARVEPEPGTLIAYAAKHGETAIDGLDKSNSPFTEALVKRIRQTPPLEIRRLFDFVRDDVWKETNKKQQPFSYGSISAEEDFYFIRPR